MVVTRAEVAEQADASVSKTDVRKDVRVRLPLSAPRQVQTVGEATRLRSNVAAPGTDVLARSPRERIERLVEHIGEPAVASWCAQVLTGAAAYDSPSRPSITWLGGRHASGELRRGDVDRRRQDHWPRVWAARGLLYAWDPAAAEAVLAGLHDPAWRVREMCAKVVRRRGIAAAEPILDRLLDDRVARVRMAAEAALTAKGRSLG